MARNRRQRWVARVTAFALVVPGNLGIAPAARANTAPKSPCQAVKFYQEQLVPEVLENLLIAPMHQATEFSGRLTPAEVCSGLGIANATLIRDYKENEAFGQKSLAHATRYLSPAMSEEEAIKGAIDVSRYGGDKERQNFSQLIANSQELHYRLEEAHAVQKKIAQERGEPKRCPPQNCVKTDLLTHMKVAMEKQIDAGEKTLVAAKSLAKKIGISAKELELIADRTQTRHKDLLSLYDADGPKEKTQAVLDEHRRSEILRADPAPKPPEHHPEETEKPVKPVSLFADGELDKLTKEASRAEAEAVDEAKRKEEARLKAEAEEAKRREEEAKRREEEAKRREEEAKRREEEAKRKGQEPPCPAPPCEEKKDDKPPASTTSDRPKETKEEPGWFARNWEWVVGGVAAVGAAAAALYFFVFKKKKKDSNSSSTAATASASIAPLDTSYTPANLCYKIISKNTTTPGCQGIPARFLPQVGGKVVPVMYACEASGANCRPIPPANTGAVMTKTDVQTGQKLCSESQSVCGPPLL